MLPVTCYNCGKAVGEYEIRFTKKFQKTNSTESIKDILDELKINKICCRILFLTHINECDILKSS